MVDETRANGIYQRKGRHGAITYYIRYQFNGVDIKERVGKKSQGFTTELAKDALRSRLGDIARGQFNLEKTRRPVPFSRLAEQYREFVSGYKRGWYEEKYIVQEFADLFGDTPLAQITTWQIEKWKSDKAKTVKQQTVNRCLTVIKHMFKTAVEWGVTNTNPATGVKRYRVISERTRFLSADEVQTDLQKCKEDLTSPWLLPLVKLALNTGMRQGELLSLEWKAINFERGTVNVLQTKTMRWKDHQH